MQQVTDTCNEQHGKARCMDDMSWSRWPYHGHRGPSGRGGVRRNPGALDQPRLYFCRLRVVVEHHVRLESRARVIFRPSPDRASDAARSPASKHSRPPSAAISTAGKAAATLHLERSTARQASTNSRRGTRAGASRPNLWDTAGTAVAAGALPGSARQGEPLSGFITPCRQQRIASRTTPA